MDYLSSHIIYNEVIDGMRAMGSTKEELAQNLEMTHDELESMLTLTRDYTISEIRHLLSGVYLDIRVEIVPEWFYKYKLALARFPYGQSATFNTHRKGENMRTASRSSNSRWTPRTHNTPGKTSAGQAVRRLAQMAERYQKIVILPPFRSAALHQNANPLPSITRSARLNKQRSGDLSLPPPPREFRRFRDFAIGDNLCISYRNSLLQKPQDSSSLCPSYPHREALSPLLPQCGVDRHPSCPARLT